MQFINIVVHSVDDMNYRVALQWEFAELGLEEYLEKLRLHESEELAVQISGKNNHHFICAGFARVEEKDKDRNKREEWRSDRRKGRKEGKEDNRREMKARGKR